MSVEKPLLNLAKDWIAILGEGLRAAIAQPAGDGGGKGKPSPVTDPDFDGWLVGDPMVTMNPASRYGDDATGFLSGSELENPDRDRTDD